LQIFRFTLQVRVELFEERLLGGSGKGKNCKEEGCKVRAGYVRLGEIGEAAGYTLGKD